jgi:hypothetical protein
LIDHRRYLFFSHLFHLAIVIGGVAGGQQEGLQYNGEEA